MSTVLGTTNNVIKIYIFRLMGNQNRLRKDIRLSHWTRFRSKKFGWKFVFFLFLRSKYLWFWGLGMDTNRVVYLILLCWLLGLVFLFCWQRLNLFLWLLLLLQLFRHSYIFLRTNYLLMFLHRFCKSILLFIFKTPYLITCISWYNHSSFRVKNKRKKFLYKLIGIKSINTFLFVLHHFF